MITAFKLIPVLISLSITNSLANESDQRLQAMELHGALQARNYNQFLDLLDAGADPAVPRTENSFKTTALCESTRIEYEQFFEAIVASGAEVRMRSNESTLMPSALVCATFYNNVYVYQRLKSLGVDLSEIQNPGSLKREFELYPFDYAIMSRRFEIAWDIVQSIEITEKQKADLIYQLEMNGGVKHSPDYPFRTKLVDWLLSDGGAVTPPSAEK